MRKAFKKVVSVMDQQTEQPSAVVFYPFAKHVEETGPVVCEEVLPVVAMTKAQQQRQEQEKMLAANPQALAITQEQFEKKNQSNDFNAATAKQSDSLPGENIMAIFSSAFTHLPASARELPPYPFLKLGR